MPLVKGVFCLAVFPTICRSHWELVSFYRRDSGFLTSCQHTTVSVHVLLIKWSSFAIHQHWSMSCFWGNAQHLSVIPVSYIMTKCHILTLCYAQCGEIINQHSWKLMRLSWKAPWRKANPAIIKTKNVEHSNRRVFFFLPLLLPPPNNYTYMPKDMWWSVNTSLNLYNLGTVTTAAKITVNCFRS